MEKRASVLVVDDDASVRQTVKAVLAGYELYEAETAGQALAALRAAPIDAAVVEPWLAGIQGRELLSCIREASPTTRLIIVTGQRLSLWFDDMIREEVYDYLPKPFDPHQLRRTIERSVGSVLRRRRFGLSGGRDASRESALQPLAGSRASGAHR